jgi:rare lipoprotein A
MRRRLAYGLALALCIAGLGAAQGNSGSDHDQSSPTPPAPQPKTTAKKAASAPKGRPYQVGTASWYGEYFQGKDTASGEPYDMYDMTAAHPSLPLGTYVKVTNLRNGRAVVVRVNDRGPVVDGRIIDLSYGAAKALRMEHHGLQQVRLDLVSQPQTVAMLQPVARLQ